MSESYCSPIRWCKNNYKFVLNHCGQFTTNQAFIQIEVFNTENMHIIKDSIYMTLRILARRVFFELKDSNELARNYCDKIKTDDTVKDVIQYLSGVWFMDIKTGESWVFLNPFSEYKVSRNMFEPYSWDKIILIDDFEDDKY